MNNKSPPEQPKNKRDLFWKFREGSALAWITVGLVFLGLIFGVAWSIYPEGSPIHFTQIIPGERIYGRPVLE